MNAPTGPVNPHTKGATQGPEYTADSLYPAPSTLDIFTSPHHTPPGMLADDLPWPELGNVSRGATRGNQGQKGVLGSPDSEGRAMLQLRVQPGVLPVKLNRQSTEWYRTLDSEVNRALKLTKTYWRKARRRQDYDARADQDHMELHEWLQQLKDKVMSHLELLMQKGEIQGPPYIMPDHVELSFLRKFIDRHNAGIPHNPRLRNGSRSPRGVSQYPEAKFSDGSSTPSMGWEPLDDREKGQDASPTLASFNGDVHAIVNEVDSNKRVLRSARAAWSRAQRETQDAFKRYKSCLDIEAQALQQVNAAEERRDALMASLMEAYRSESEVSETSSRKSFAAEEATPSSVATAVEPRSSPKQIHDQPIPCNYKPNTMAVQDVNSWRPTMREMHPQWSADVATMGVATASGSASSQMYAQDIAMDVQDPSGRKHSRSWDMAQAHAELEDFTSRKRLHEDDPTMSASRTTQMQMRRNSDYPLSMQAINHQTMLQ